MNNNLDTIDKLVEFGMGLALSQQMMNTLKQTTPPPSNLSTPQTEYVYYAIINARQLGPLTVEELAKLISDKQITTETLMWYPGMPAWSPAKEIREVNKLLLLNSTL